MEKIFLNVRTSYSILSSLITLDNYLNYAKKNNLTRLAICDNNMYGVYEFYTKCLYNNIIPIIGLNFYVLFKEKKYNFHIFAINKNGYYLLVHISSWIMLNNQKLNIIPFNILKKYLNNNLKIIINYEKKNYNDLLYITILNLLKSDINLYLGINYNNFSLLLFFKQLSNMKNIIWNNKVFYFSYNDFHAYTIINSIKKQIILEKNDITNNYWINNIEKKYSIYLKNNWILVKNIKKFYFKIKNISNNILKYPNITNISSFKLLYRICNIKLKLLFNKNIDINYINRLNYELNIIKLMKFSDYFLIVWDYVNYAKKNNIYVGPGRGSVSGSLVSYLLNITTIDPIKYNLLFERFLNLQKTYFPDIDIDFEDIKRKKIVQYLLKKYGKNHIAFIITFQKISIKTAIYDISKILNISNIEINIINKSIKSKNNYNYNTLFIKNNILQYYNKKYPKLFLYLKYLIGLPRKISTHSSGIILSKEILCNFLPIKLGYNGIYQSQYSKNCLQNLGLMKLDILGLKNLTIIHDIINNINKDQHITINIDNISLNDSKTFNILAQGKTTGIFQLESLIMKKLLIKIKPNNIEDIASTLALYRPASKENIYLFINRKNKKIPIIYIDDRLKDILCVTYGVILYQEQIMLIVQKMANFSLEKSDILRIAIYIKNIKLLQKLKHEFIQNSINNFYKLNVINKMWEWINKFSLYGFNRSHAIAYSLIGYQMSYLKSNFFVYFVTSLLNTVVGNDQKTNYYLQLANLNNIKIIPPSINNPLLKYIVKNGNIYLPLLIIKQINLFFCNIILKDYKKYGKYIDIFDLFFRLYKKGLNRSIYEALCYSHSLEDFKINKTTLYNNYNIIMTYIKLILINNNKFINNQLSIIDKKLVDKPNIVFYKDNLNIILEKEYKFLGFYLLDDKLNYIRKHLKYNDQLIFIKHLKLKQNKINILCIIKQYKVIKDKNNYDMAFLICCDETGIIRIIVFANQYNKYYNFFNINNIVLINIKLILNQNKICGILNWIKCFK